MNVTNSLLRRHWAESASQILISHTNKTRHEGMTAPYISCMTYGGYDIVPIQFKAGFVF